MYPKYRLNSLGYDCPPDFDTIGEARAELKANVQYDLDNAPYKLARVNHDRDSIELKIGSKQGVHTYSYYTISIVR